MSDEEGRLFKCPICFRFVCGNCCVREYGRQFCSASCANQFFFGDEDE